MMVMRDENTEVISLQSPDTSLKFSARVYWNPDSKETFLDVLNLSEPGLDQQYHLWVYSKGKTMDAGFFDVHDFSGIQRMKEIQTFDMLAIHLEPKGGSPVPLPEQLVLASKVIEIK